MKIARGTPQPPAAAGGARAGCALVRLMVVLLSVAVLLLHAHPGRAQSPADAQSIVHILDYLGVDYAGAVQDGRVRNADEYSEMLEFSGQVGASLKALPENPRRAALIAESAALARMVAGKAHAPEVEEAARKLRWGVIEAYGVQVAPRVPPDPKVAAGLYQSLCASCHGAEGRGDGPAAAQLDPRPANFHDSARMAQRSVYGLYNTITLGVKGTAMAGFATLTEAQRWALGLYVAAFPDTQETRAQGASLWRQGKGRSAFPGLADLMTLTSNEIAERSGADALAVRSYLLADPKALSADKPDALAFARATLVDALRAYREGNHKAAYQLAVKAYIEGYEMVEASLSNVDEKLMREGEREMIALRELMRQEAPLAQVETQAQRLAAVLERARTALDAGALSPATTFVSALVILLREGLEALLVVAAIIAFLLKANRRDALVWVHGGWAGALALGVVTWALASYAIDISGAHREITEGVTGLIAAAMLVYVGYWLHGKASAQAWQSFIGDSVGSALASRTLWTLAGVSFLAVYREVFETVLFYQTLWVQAGESARGAFLGGIAAAAAALFAIGWGIFRYSLRLPLGPFFNLMSALMCVLAVVLAGKGMAALQEAGVIGASPVDLPSVPLLGVFPTVQTLAAQAAVVACIAAMLYFGSHRAPGPAQKAGKA